MEILAHSMEISFQIWKFSSRYTENQNMRMEALQICHIVHIFWHGIPLLCLFWYNISVKSLFDVQITSNITTNNKFYSVPIIITIFKYYTYNTGKFERHWLPEITEKLNESRSHCNNRY
jgi:hypothetical protein